MKQLFTLLLLLCSTALFAQNWCPILVNEKMNYQHSDSSYISHTIWVDSAFSIEADSIFYLNRIVKDVPDNPEIVLRNQPQFLTEFMVKQIYGIYSFHYPNNYMILTQSGIGASWDFTNNIQADITEITFEEIFGVMDSIKVISLSDGNEILLSKNFGILKFPDFENDGYYELVGIQNTEYGESVIDFWDIFDFEVEDVFQYYKEFYWPGYYEVTTIKTQINSKEINNNSITYNVYRITRKLLYGQTTINIYTGDLVYNNIVNSRVNKFQNEILLLEDYYCSPNYSDPNLYSRILINTDSLGLKVKHWGNDLGVNHTELFYEAEPLSDTLIKLIDAECLSGQPHGLAWSEGLGWTLEFYDDNFESWYYITLIGYIKDGDTVGTITSDSLLLVGVDTHHLNKSFSFQVYPNPAKKWLYIKQLNPNLTYNIELRNLYGQMVKKEKNIQSTHYAMNVADLKAGVYFYVIKEHDEIVQQGKLIIK